MSLDLPEFGAPARSTAGAVWRAVRLLGIGVFVYALWVCAAAWNEGRVAEQALTNSKNLTAAARANAEELRKRLMKSPDALVALASVESSPERVMEDLKPLVPPGVAISSLRVEYVADSAARVDLGVVAASPEAYDRFLRALAKSPAFSGIKPGSENRPGPLRATVSALHRPGREIS